MSEWVSIVEAWLHHHIDSSSLIKFFVGDTILDIDVSMIENMKFTIQYLPGIQVTLAYDDFDLYYSYPT